MSDTAILAALAGMTALKAGQDEGVAAIARLEAAQGANFARLGTRLEAEIARLRADAMERLDRHAAVLTTLRDDIAVNFAASGVAQRADDSPRQELAALREIMSSLALQIKALQERVIALESGS